MISIWHSFQWLMAQYISSNINIEKNSHLELFRLRHQARGVSAITGDCGFMCLGSKSMTGPRWGWGWVLYSSCVNNLSLTWFNILHIMGMEMGQYLHHAIWMGEWLPIYQLCISMWKPGYQGLDKSKICSSLGTDLVDTQSGDPLYRESLAALENPGPNPESHLTTGPMDVAKDDFFASNIKPLCLAHIFLLHKTK